MLTVIKKSQNQLQELTDLETHIKNADSTFRLSRAGKSMMRSKRWKKAGIRLSVGGTPSETCRLRDCWCGHVDARTLMFQALSIVLIRWVSYIIESI